MERSVMALTGREQGCGPPPYEGMRGQAKYQATLVRDEIAMHRMPTLTNDGKGISKFKPMYIRQSFIFLRTVCRSRRATQPNPVYYVYSTNSME